MFNISNIKGTDDYLIFFKIIEKKYCNNLIKDGQVYFNLLSFYRELEKVKGKTSIGDQNEGLLTKQINEYIGYAGDYYQIHGEQSGYNVKIDSNQCAFCTYAIGLKKFTLDCKNNYYHKIPYSVIRDICKDKGGVDNCILVVFDIDIINKICNTLKGKRSFCRGPVIYDDFYYIPKNDIDSTQYALECCFHKESKYKYQQEYRIAAINDKKHPIDDLYISVTKNDFDIIELKENRDFYCYLKVDSKQIESFNDKERWGVKLLFSFDLK